MTYLYIPSDVIPYNHEMNHDRGSSSDLGRQGSPAAPGRGFGGFSAKRSAEAADPTALRGPPNLGLRGPCDVVVVVMAKKLVKKWFARDDYGG